MWLRYVRFLAHPGNLFRGHNPGLTCCVSGSGHDLTVQVHDTKGTRTRVPRCLRFTLWASWATEGSCLFIVVYDLHWWDTDKKYQNNKKHTIKHSTQRKKNIFNNSGVDICFVFFHTQGLLQVLQGRESWGGSSVWSLNLYLIELTPADNFENVFKD